MAKPTSPEIGVATVCAHEFGHVLQFKSGVYSQLISPDGRVKRLELHADFLAGYFAGRRKLLDTAFPAEMFAATQDMFGDTQFNSPNHHGTNEERGAAVVQGFNVSYREKKGLHSAVADGMQYVQGISL